MIRAAIRRFIARHVVADEPAHLYVPSRLDAADGIGTGPYVALVYCVTAGGWTVTAQRGTMAAASVAAYTGLCHAPDTAAVVDVRSGVVGSIRGELTASELDDVVVYARMADALATAHVAH